MGEVHVIRFKPETVKEARNRWGQDLEKVPTTPVRGLTVHGVALSSRYDKADEYDAMAAIIEALPPELRCIIESVVCDSKATASFDVQLRSAVPLGFAYQIGHAFEQACFVTIGGHNGISINPGHVLIDADWREPLDSH